LQLNKSFGRSDQESSYSPVFYEPITIHYQDPTLKDTMQQHGNDL
jgi:hypothetical protein